MRDKLALSSNLSSYYNYDYDNNNNNNNNNLGLNSDRTI